MTVMMMMTVMKEKRRSLKRTVIAMQRIARYVSNIDGHIRTKSLHCDRAGEPEPPFFREAGAALKKMAGSGSF